MFEHLRCRSLKILESSRINTLYIIITEISTFDVYEDMISYERVVCAVKSFKQFCAMYFQVEKHSIHQCGRVPLTKRTETAEKYWYSQYASSNILIYIYLFF